MFHKLMTIPEPVLRDGVLLCLRLHDQEYTPILFMAIREGLVIWLETNPKTIAYTEKRWLEEIAAGGGSETALDCQHPHPHSKQNIHWYFMEE